MQRNGGIHTVIDKFENEWWGGNGLDLMKQFVEGGLTPGLFLAALPSMIRIETTPLVAALQETCDIE